MMGSANLYVPPTVDLHDALYEDDSHPEIQVPPAISAIHLEQLYQQKKLECPWWWA